MLDAVPVLRPRRRRSPPPRCRSCSTSRRHAACSMRPPRCRTTRRAPRANPPHRVRAVLRARAARRRACGLRLADVDVDRALLVVRGGKFGKTCLVPHGPRIGALLRAQLDYRRTAVAASEMDALLFTRRRWCMHPRHGQPGVPPPRRRSRPSRHRRGQSAAVALAAAFLRGRVPAALVSRRPRSRRAAVAAVHVHGARRSRIDRGLPADHPGLLTEANRRFEAFAEPAWLQAAP